jgi:hypothetical protein
VPIVAAAALLATLALAGPAAAQDSITPSNVDIELRPGKTFEVTKHLHLDAAPPKADIVLAIDTTNTMKPVLNQAKAEATQLVAELKALIPGARFAVVDFRDYPFEAGRETPWPYKLRTETVGLTADAGTVQAAINGMSTGTGGSPNEPEDPDPPEPEAYNRVLYEATAEPRLTTYAPDQGGYDPEAERFLVVLGDEVPRDTDRPERNARFGACLTSRVVDPGRNGAVEDGGGDDLKTEAVVQGLIDAKQTLLMLNYRGTSGQNYLNCYKQLAQPTGGDAFDGGNPAQLREKIVTAITGATQQINKIELVVEPAGCPLAYTFASTADGSAPPWGPLTVPQNGTGLNFSFTETVKAPADAGSYNCSLKVIVDGAERAVQTFHADVVPPPTTTTTTTTTTLPPPSSSVASATTTPPTALPFSGAGATVPLLAGGLALIVLGVLSLLGGRRRRAG